jgi:hypothetical protein
VNRAGLVAAALLALVAAAAQGASQAVNFQTKTADVVCGVAGYVPGTEFDAGTQAELDGNYDGLQCSAEGLPLSKNGVGDPAIQLGHGSSGRARLVYTSQDNYISDARFVTLAPGSTWKRFDITCTLTASSVRCVNANGHGFTLSTDHHKLF